MAKEKKPFSFTSVDLLVFAWDKRVILIIVSVAVAVLSAILSFRITELYKSSVVLFPASSTSVSKALLSDQYAGRQALLEFGEEEQAEQLLQVLNSDQIRNRIIQKYDLMDHYDIDPDYKYRHTLLNNKYSQYITFKRTKFMSIIIEVLDKDPVTAANIANDIAMLIDSTMNTIQHERVMLAYRTVENEYLELQHQIKDLEDSLNVLRNLGIYEYESQSEVMNDAYATAISENNVRAQKILEDQLKLLAKYGGAYVSIRDFLKYEKENLSELKAKYAEAKVEAEQVLPHKYIVNNAFPAERKSYPKKSIIVLESTFFAFIFTYIILLIINLIRNRKKELIQK